MSEPFYTRSNGQRVLLKEMATPHLRSAFFKLQRDDPESPELPSMKAEVRARAVQWRAELVDERPGAEADRQAEIDGLLEKVDEELSGVLAE